MNLPSEGTRINLAGHLGTIKFVGPVDGTNGIWLGIEWDDPQRGRHDGIKDGKRYFTCRIQDAGSFIRPSASISYGKSFLEALTSKYIETLHGSESQEKVLLGSSRGAIIVEGVRLDKVRGKLACLERLREVSLDNESLARSDPVGAIRRACPNIRGLDLSMNLLSSWDAVAMIVRELPALQRLALNRNRFQPVADRSAMIAAFTGLTELQLNGTLMTWSDMQAAIADMPNLRIVEMGYNRLASLSTSATHLPDNRALQVINLDSNMCSDWVHVYKSLRQYLSLERVVLPSNCVDAIPLPETTQHRLSSLKHISLSFNKLNAWGDVDALSSWCPGLETLSLGGNPLMDRELGRYARPFTIAKIPSLLVLDGALISPKERTDSEIFYLSQVVQRIASEDERVQAHPQWLSLCAKHGKPDKAVNSKAAKDKLCNRLIALNLYESTRSDFDLALVQTLLEPITFHILPTMSLRTLRMKIRKVTKRKTDTVLWLKMDDGTFSKLHADEDSRELGWLGLENGSNLVFSML